jgi:predicted porin
VFAALSGTALAGGDNVELYGVVDAGISHVSGLAPGGGGAGQTVSSTQLASGVQTPDRLGVRGSENIGGGTSVIFTAETGFCGTGTNVDAKASETGSFQTFCSGGSFMQRLAFVGLKGHFGMLQAGRVYIPFFANEFNMDPFKYGLNGDIGNLSISGAPYSFGLVRANQAVRYFSPDFGGFSGQILYSFAPGNGGAVPSASGANSNVTRMWDLNGQYANGPLTAGLDYLQETNLYDNPVSLVNDGALKAWQGYASYNFQVATLSAIYEEAKQDYSGGKDKFWMLGVTIPIGQGSVLASYGENNNGLMKGTTQAANFGTAKQYAIGYTYNLSKQTDLFASFGHLTNGPTTSYINGTSDQINVPGNYTGVAGQSSNGISIGIKHDF